MLLFGHIGFTLASALVLNEISGRNRSFIPQELKEEAGNTATKPVSFIKRLSNRLWMLIKRTEGIDLRFIIIGSLLPDIIDKPIGNLFFWDKFGNGYLYCHTLLFVLFLFFVGYLIRVIFNKNHILLLAFGSLVHLILDFVFLNPHVFFWPLFGFNFIKGSSPPFMEWLLGLVIQVVDKPWIVVPELTGAMITVWFFCLLWRRKRLRTFILNGQV